MNSTTDNEIKATEVKPKEKSHWLTWIASAFSALTVVLLLLGYGATLGIESTTGIPHGSMIGSPADLIELSSIPLMELVSVMADALAQRSSYELLISSVWRPILGLSILMLIMFTAGYFWYRFKNKNANKSPTPSKIKPKKPSEKNANFAWQHWKIYLQVQAFLLALPVILLSGAAVIVYFVALIGIIPIFGAKATESHFKNWVVAPEICLPLRNSPSRKDNVPGGKKVNAANCVAITKDERFVGAGRVVLSTSKTIVLYTPHDGKVKRIPLEGAVVEVVSKLPD